MTKRRAPQDRSEAVLRPTHYGVFHPDARARLRGGTVNLMGCGRNDARDEAGDTDGYAVAATPVTSAQV